MKPETTVAASARDLYLKYLLIPSAVLFGLGAGELLAILMTGRSL